MPYARPSISSPDSLLYLAHSGFKRVIELGPVRAKVNLSMAVRAQRNNVPRIIRTAVTEAPNMMGL
jgi:hypothetical protein